MDRTERFYLIRQFLSQSRSVNTRQFLERLEVSPATLKRDIEYLRERFRAPILWRRDLAGYDIFSGRQLQWATLRFSVERARWVTSEFWHPEQKFCWPSDGRYVLETPYLDHRELLMGILKHGTHCEVLAPKTLRQRVTKELYEMVANYAK